MRGFFNFFRMLALVSIIILVPNLQADDPTSLKEKLFFWKVTSPTSTVYLLGSIHVGRPEWYPLDATIENAFKISDDVTFEIAVERRAMQLLALMQMHGIYQPGDSLDKHISKETVEKLDAFLKKNEITLPQVSQMKPWYISMYLPLLVEAKNGYKAEQGIDYYFTLKAKRLHKPIGELEEVMDQIGIMFKLSDRLQQKMLLEMFDEAGKEEYEVSTLYENWRVGDTKTFQQLHEDMVEESKDDPEMKTFVHQFVTGRNQRMMKVVEKYLKDSHTHFVIAGSMHMVGPDGLVELCRKKGYTVIQLTASGQPAGPDPVRPKQKPAETPELVAP